MNQLYKHQQKIIDDNPIKTGLWLGCGTGKTRTALNLSGGKTLVIAPKTQRDDKNWERELEEIGLGLDLVVVSKEDFKNPKKFKKIEYQTLIVDEAHKMLGVYPTTIRRQGKEYPKASQLFYELYKYVKVYKPERIYLATATISKSPLTVWGAGVILGKWSLESFFRFRVKYYMTIRANNRDIWIPREDKNTQDELIKVIKSLGYTGRLEDYFDVPDQTYKIDHIELTTEQKKYLKEVRTDYPEPIVQVGKRHQVENGVLKGDEFSPSVEIKDNKIERLQEYAIEFDRMIVFAKYTEQIEKIKKGLRGYNVYTLSGKTKDRGQLLKDLKVKDKYILIVQTQVSEGWELPECPVMIFASNGYSFVDREQGEGRILRSNNLKKNLYIDLVVKGSVDEAIKRSLDKKQDFNEKVFIDNE